MKTIPLFGMALLLMLSVACKNENGGYEASAETPAEEVTTGQESDVAGNAVVLSDSVASEKSLSSSAAVENNDGKHKFVRTAEIRFKVRNVAQSTGKVEDAVSKAGGFVVTTDLKSAVNETRDVKKSQDSIVRTTVYTVHNDMVIRVPNYNLDATLKNISKEVGYLDYRIIKAEDVNLQLKASELERKRLAKFSKRVETAVEDKGKKLADINETENNLLAKQETSDTALLKKLELEDKIAYSTVALQLYQDEAVKSVTLANLDSANYRTGFGTKAWDSLKSGWYILESILVVLLNLWPFLIIGGLAYFTWKKINGKKLAA